MNDLGVMQHLLHAFLTGENIHEAEEYYAALLTADPIHVVQVLFDSISQSTKDRSLQFILLSRIFLSFGHRFCEVSDDAFHHWILTTLMTHLSSPAFSLKERRHLAFLVSRASAVYRDWPELPDFLLRLCNDPDFEIAATGIDCLGLCAENKSRLLPDEAYVDLLTRLISFPKQLTIGPSLRLLYAVVRNSDSPEIYHLLLDGILPILHAFLDSPIISHLMSNFCSFLENSQKIMKQLCPSLIRAMMEIMNDRRLPDELRICSGYIIELLLARCPELFTSNELALEIFDLCVNHFSELKVAQDVLSQVAEIFGGTIDFILHCADAFISFEGQQAFAFDILGICFPSCVSHFAFSFQEWVMPSLLVGCGHSNEAIREHAFSMLADVLRALPSCEFHNAPLLDIIHLILHALSCETNSVALSSELRALSKFCRYCFVPSLHPVGDIIAACDHFFPTDNKLALVTCYRDLVDGGCCLSEQSVAFLISILQGPPEGPVFFKVLGSIHSFLTLFPTSIVPVVESFLVHFLEDCVLDDLNPNDLQALHRVLLGIGNRNPEGAFPLFGRFLEHDLRKATVPLPVCEMETSEPLLWDCETFVDAARNVAVQAHECDLRERRLLLFDLLEAICACPAAAAAHGAALGDLACGLLVGHLWDALTPIALDIACAAVSLCPGLPEVLLGPLINIVDLRPTEKTHILHTLAAVISALQAPDVPGVIAFVRDQILRGAAGHRVDEQRCDAIGDVRYYHLDFEEGSLEHAILLVVHSVENHPAYPMTLADLLRSLFHYTESFISKLVLMLAADYIRLPAVDPAVIAETIAYCEAQLNICRDFRQFTLCVIGVFLLHRVFTVQQFLRFVDCALSIVGENPPQIVGDAGLIALMIGVLSYGSECDCEAIVQLLINRGPGISIWYMSDLFPDDIARTLVGLLRNVSPLSSGLARGMALDVLRHQQKLSPQVRQVLTDAVQVFESATGEIMETT
jgi:hypothetical protein